MTHSVQVRKDESNHDVHEWSWEDPPEHGDPPGGIEEGKITFTFHLCQYSA